MKYRRLESKQVKSALAIDDRRIMGKSKRRRIVACVCICHHTADVDVYWSEAHPPICAAYYK